MDKYLITGQTNMMTDQSQHSSVTAMTRSSWQKEIIMQ